MTLRDHLGPRTPENAALHDELDRLLAARAVALGEGVVAGWNACRLSVYAFCEDIRDREAEEIKDQSDHAQGFKRGLSRAAKSIARGFGAMEAKDDDHTTEAIRALADTDSTEALNRVIRAHVQKALEMARKVGDVVEHTDRPNWANEGAWAHCTEVYTMRIVAITADDVLREMGWQK